MCLECTYTTIMEERENEFERLNIKNMGGLEGERRNLWNYSIISKNEKIIK